VNRSTSFLYEERVSSRSTATQLGKTTHPTSERLERVHRLVVLGLVLSELLVDPDGRLESSTPLRTARSGIVAVALEVADLLVELETVGLQRLDLGAEARDGLELLAEFLWVERASASG